jgi:transposase
LGVSYDAGVSTADRGRLLLGVCEPVCSVARTASRIRTCCPATGVNTHSRLVCPLTVLRGGNASETLMDTLHPLCAGLDVHKDTVVASVRRLDQRNRPKSEVRTFGTTTPDLLGLLDWLVAEGVPVVAMESTGVYWKPVFNLLEASMQVLLVNPEHIKQVPGRKTDVRDCEWIAQLLQCGLLKPSFVPPRLIRDLRDLTRQRSKLVGERAGVANRVQKVLEDANVKLGSVASDVLGKSGRAMLEAIIAGQSDAAVLAGLALGRMRSKKEALGKALTGRVTQHHRFMLRLHLDQFDQLEKLIERLDERIAAVIAADRPDDPPPSGGDGPTAATQSPVSVGDQANRTDRPAARASRLAPALELLMTIPGIGRRSAEVVVAEIGSDMGRFATAHKLAAWAGMCPGNDASAGKRRSGRTRHGDRWLRVALVQAAWAVSRSKQTYASSQYHRLARRRGRKKACVAVGHTLLVMCYQVLRTGQPYRELGADYFDKKDPQRLANRLIRRLQELGLKVTVETQNAA